MRSGRRLFVLTVMVMALQGFMILKCAKIDKVACAIKNHYAACEVME